MASFLRTLFLGASIALIGAAAHADSNAPIRLVIGFPPGGALDNLARSLAEDLRTTLKEPVLVENRPGASTRISIEAVKAARPDGRTILLGATPPFVLFPMTYARLNYDVDKDFIPIAHLANVPSVLSAGAGQPFKTLPEYVAWVRKNPTGASVGLTNLGGALHFSVLQLSKAIGVPLAPVTYKGGAPLATDLIGGHVPFAADALASQLELHRAGKLRILGVAGTRRLSWLPDVPTIKESGYDAFDRANAAYAAFVPAGTPKDVAAKLEAALLAAMRNPQVRAQVDRMGLEATGLPGAEVTRIMREDRAYWRPIVKASGFRSED
ncbi:tripartite tricarboxylate transporter substrate-binding protein (plasmid) [Variovorax sp. V59]|uniref:Tripartite-type tricarboxylate transporter receptor subunit TctC n=2 Tax=Variovorax TaxID=34072 RepID=A0AAE3XXE3_VARPD|nr:MULTISPECIES: tripartite tricarboxylate transporter substrate-binding protein [Variovorax]MBD9667855.1 tripartite tricarboxylate transporter substrate binding protein [Variovorax sp. VRV01]MDP9964418.1 tripartite-type tricarboxylate transporter receptor subunit TctC [Variovorax paradoxus]MDR6427348.1 tripartite-type tricarboxylate transporter receptor subunit TctC [Variovorax paradoxus]MDR6454509.1 tripartite-type tricarboxylate transporter receptor subunit TctC [Variovorax paradoxus]TWD855